MRIELISPENRNRINDFIKTQWFSVDMVVRGEIVDMTKMDGFVIYENASVIGLITYRIINNECEIMSLDSLREQQGIGTALLNRVKQMAIIKNCSKLKLITTNDNINAIRFYQKRGFDLVHLYHNALETSRKLKPSIPVTGDHGIPIRHELEFELNLSNNN